MSKKKKRRPGPRKVARYIKFRAGLVFLVVLGLMCFLLIRIIFINQYDGQDYNKTILTQMSYDSQTIYAERGKILDRNGTSLAYNENRYNLIIEPKNILLYEADTEATINALVECYGYDRAELEKRIQDNKDSYYVRLEKQITEDERQLFLDYKEEYENAEESELSSLNTQSASGDDAQTSDDGTQSSESSPESSEGDAESDGSNTSSGEGSAEAAESSASESGEGNSDNFLVKAFQTVKAFFSDTETEKVTQKKGRIVGVVFETNQKRVYPYNEMASTTIGFANSAGGVSGLELQYNDLLSGTNGRRYGYLNQESSVEVQTIQETDGYSLRTTIDSYIQKICEDIIFKYEEETGSNVTAIMAMNPNNGEIYAMAASRQFDLNNPTDLTDIYTQEEIDAMSDEEKSEALLLRWRNFCTSSSYEPGSTAKVFTVAAGLEENKLNPEDRFVCDGVKIYSGARIHCHKRSGHGSLTVTGALMASCNDALMQIGDLVGIDDFCEYQSRFNFGQLTGIDLPDELSCSNQIYRADNMTAIDLACNSFGQNFYVTMVQMCAAYASLVNGGNYYEPHVVKQILDNEGNVVENIEPKLVRQTISKNTSEFMKEALLQVVENGTGSRVQIEGYEIGGKTGTAEKANVGDEDETYTVSFMSVAPAYDPELILYVVVDEPNVDKSLNTYQAKDLCKAALEQILPYLNIYPTADNENISTANGDFTSPEDDELYTDDDTPIIENPEDTAASQQIRDAAQAAQNQAPDNSSGQD